MERFFTSIEKAIEAQDWYGALSTALTIPDIAGKLENPELGVGARYKGWYRNWLQDKYTGSGPAGNHIFLSDEDCYGLRCSYLHAGGGELERKAKHTLERFHFIQPPKWGRAHLNQLNNVLQLQVDEFCNDMVEAGRRWFHWTQTERPDVVQRMDALLIIHNADNGIPGLINFG
ncbi:hypothetical protein GPM19_00615 [Halomonas sp. ZH2S]|uniref:Uncharacterized protein n=1 Tax=Vreelandella zhuhanensis TaxID=2684210 RepID=A0A7X3GXT9_9GAMM|nr:hypothetical protein [Halomonas zhuhanensis]MWJ26721.1 hypothetical protein [Halomonas zhuhanensis]